MSTAPDLGEGDGSKREQGASHEGGLDIKGRYQRSKTRVANVATSLKSTLLGLPRDSVGRQQAVFEGLQGQLTRLNERTDAQFGTEGETLQFATPEQLERAKEGATEFRDLLSSIGSEQIKTEVRQGDFGIKLQAMYLGLKPVTFLHGADLALAHSLSLPSRFQIFNSPYGETLLYDEDLVKKTVTTYPDLFPRIGEQQDMADYLRSIYPEGSIAGDNDGAVRTAQTGLLLGFPENAVRINAENHDLCSQAYKLLRERIQYTHMFEERKRGASGMNPQILDALEVLTGYNTVANFRTRAEQLQGRRVININRPYILRYVKDCLTENGISATDEQIAYIVDRQPVTGYGFDWGGTAKDRDFLPTVIELFDKSGMSALGNLSQQFVNNIITDGLDLSETEPVITQHEDPERIADMMKELHSQAESVLLDPQTDIDPAQYDYVRRRGKVDHKASDRMERNPKLPRGQKIEHPLQFHTQYGSTDTFTILRGSNGNHIFVEMNQGEIRITSLKKHDADSSYHTFAVIQLSPDGSFDVHAKQFADDDSYSRREETFHDEIGGHPISLAVIPQRGEVSHVMSANEIQEILRTMQEGERDTQMMLRAVVRGRRSRPYFISEAEYQAFSQN